MEKYHLNYGWIYRSDFDDSYPQIAIEGELVDIPHCNSMVDYNNFDEKTYQYVSCYQRKINIPASFAQKRVFLRFEAVMCYAEVFVNGELAFFHSGGYTAFEGEITQYIKQGENTLTVKVDSREREDIPPFGNVIDYLTYGGIYREVSLLVREENFIKNVFISPLRVLSDKKAVGVKVVTEKALKEGETIVCNIEDEGQILESVEWRAKESTENEFEIAFAKAVLWEPSRPKLYRLTVEVCGEKVSETFGMRIAEFTKRGFYLNGKESKILGLNRHQSFPYVGYAMPKSAQEEDALKLKELGVNLVRTSHYVNSRHFLEACDKLGLMVFTEIPGWQFVSKREDWRANAIESVREMIEECYNHPSIVLWGVRINESPDDDELYRKTNALAHALDKTRQTGGVRCIPQSKLLEDVYTFNDFTNNGAKMKLMPKFIVTKLNAPLLITEHNGHMFPTKSFDNEKRRTEHALRHAEVINQANKRKNTCGAIGWCMSDYNTHKDFGSGDKICYHGVTDMFRMDKQAAFVYKSQQDDIPVLEVSSNMEIGDHDAAKLGDVYIYTNCDEVKMYKNDAFVASYYPRKQALKALKHPPIILNDMIGNQIEKNEKVSKRAAKRLKKFCLSIASRGAVPAAIRNLLPLVWIMGRYRLNFAAIQDMYGKYVTGWGGAQTNFRFEGIKNGKSVVSVNKGSVMKKQLQVRPLKNELVIKDTYDTVKVEIRALSDFGNVLPYCFDAITLEAENLEVLGETSCAFIGGQRAVWVKTLNAGKATLRIKTGFADKTIEFEVKDERKQINIL